VSENIRDLLLTEPPDPPVLPEEVRYDLARFVVHISQNTKRVSRTIRREKLPLSATPDSRIKKAARALAADD
jgi:hypothetical protein